MNRDLIITVAIIGILISIFLGWQDSREGSEGFRRVQLQDGVECVVLVNYFGEDKGISCNWRRY